MTAELFLFVRPPRPLWPFNGPSTAFWPPLAFASMAAALREAIPDLKVAVLDAPALKMGWATLERKVMSLRPAYVAIGEEAVSCVEGLRIARLAKQLGAKVIAGGCFFGNVAKFAIESGQIDVVVHGEGEQTIVELVQALRSGASSELRAVRGITFRDGDEVVATGWREPICDLDDLPFPAYDLLPVEAYGGTSKNHPALAAIELGRGCAHDCAFCVLWRQMASARDGELRPKLRTKSAERLREEVRILTSRYGRKYLGWVDPCFNAHPTIPAQLSEMLLKDGIHVGQSAWVRSDFLARDHRSGALKTCVDAGLNEIYIGIERTTDSDLNQLHKCTPIDVRETLGHIARDYPDISIVGSFIYGVPSETPETLRAMLRTAYTLPLDLIFFIPLTPLPGTPYWAEQMWDSSGQQFRSCDFLPHLNGSGSNLDRLLAWSLIVDWPRGRFSDKMRGLFARRSRKRRIYWHYNLRVLSYFVRAFAAGLRHRPAMRYPEWYYD